MRLWLKFFTLFLIVAVFLGSGVAGSVIASPGDTEDESWDSQSEELFAPPPNITAEFAAVIDGDSGAVLYAKDIHSRVPPASLTKIVTAIVAMEKGKLNDIVKIDVDSKKLEAETNSSTMGLMPGEEISLEALLYGLMLPSGNDAAIAIARHIGGSEQRFIQMMNDKVKELGFTNSRFVNPHGLDARDHYSTAYEMAMLGREAMKNAAFAKIAATKEITVAGKQKKYYLENTNALLWDYIGADGVKIGYTYGARQAIVASVKRDGRRLFVSLIRSNARVADSRTLFNYFFSLPVSSSRSQPATTPTPIVISTPTPLPTPSPTPVPTRTFTPIPTPTRTSTPTATPTQTSSPTLTPTPTPTPEPVDNGKRGKQEYWYETLLGVPWKAIRTAFSFIGVALPQ